MSTTTRGRSACGMWVVAAASSGSAPTFKETSGNAVRRGLWMGPIYPSQRLYYLLYKGQSNDSSCPKPDRATQRSSLDEIAVSMW